MSIILLCKSLSKSGAIKSILNRLLKNKTDYPPCNYYSEEEKL